MFQLQSTEKRQTFGTRLKKEIPQAKILQEIASMFALLTHGESSTEFPLPIKFVELESTSRSLNSWNSFD